MNKQIVIFGAGDFGKKALNYFDYSKVYGFVDNNPEKQGASYLGKPVFSLEKYINEFSHLELVVAMSNYKAIIDQLAAVGLFQFRLFTEVNDELSVRTIHNYSGMAKNGLFRHTEQLETLNECTGCGSCLNACTENAINIVEDEQGFLRPSIIKEKCTRCRVCLDKCPVLYPEYNNFDNPDCYAIQANDQDRLSCSDGGIGLVLAKKVLLRNGIVFGPRWNKDFSVEIKEITNESELEDFNRHKYIQSTTGLTFRKAKEYLEEGRVVFYFGLPSQIAGLNRFLGKQYNNLITIDIICGPIIPSRLFKQYLSENYDINKIDKYEFQTKDLGWIDRNFAVNKVIFKDGSIMYTNESDPLMRAYHQGLCATDASLDCSFSDVPRQGDLSVGDYWGIGRYRGEWNDEKGTNAVAVNSLKGEALLKSVANQLKLMEKTPLDWFKELILPGVYQRSIRVRFFSLLQYISFNKAVDYCLSPKWDVCVISNLSEYNYGAELTYYALYKFLLNEKFEPLMVQQPLESISKPIQNPRLFAANPYRKFDLCSIFQTKDKMYKINDYSDTFILGSDQMWNPFLMARWSGVSDLSYVKSEKKKIAYATSFGLDTWNGNEIQTLEMKNTLSRFDFVSTRELSGTTICDKVFDTKAEMCIDPVFLLKEDEYRDLANNSSIDCDGDYLFAYILKRSEDPAIQLSEETAETLKALQSIRKTLNINIKAIIGKKTANIENLLDGIEIIEDACVEDWLKLISNSRYIVTNSFHGVCFSLLFNKQFMAAASSMWGGNRILSVLELFNLSERVKNDIFKISGEEFANKIDYTQVKNSMDAEIARCRNWLLQSIRNPSGRKLSDKDLLWNKMIKIAYKMGSK